MTASVDTVDFLRPIDIGELVTMKASVNYVGNTSMVIGIRVEAENIQTGDVKHCNSSYITMVAKDKNGDSVKIPGLILEDENEKRRFLKSVKRIKIKRHRSDEFNETDFSSEKYLEEFSSYRVQIV